MKHKSTVLLPKELIDKLNQKLSVLSFDDLTEEEMNEKNLKVDDFIGLYEAQFDDGARITCDVCSGSNNYFDNVVWYSPDNKVEVCLDCTYEIDDIEFSYGENDYIVKIISE